MATSLVFRDQAGIESTATEIALPARTVAAGNALVLVILRAGPSSTVNVPTLAPNSITDTAGYTWHQAGYIGETTTTWDLFIYYTYNCAAQVNNVVKLQGFTGFNYTSLTLYQISGNFGAADPFQSTANSPTGSSLTPTTATPVVLNGWNGIIIAGIAFRVQPIGFAGGAGYTAFNYVPGASGDGNKYLGDEYLLTSADSSPSFSQTSPVSNAIIAAGFGEPPTQTVSGSTLSSGSSLHAPIVRYLISMPTRSSSAIIRVPSVAHQVVDATIPSGSSVRVPAVKYLVGGPHLGTTAVLRVPSVIYLVSLATVGSTVVLRPVTVLGLFSIATGVRASTVSLHAPKVAYQVIEMPILTTTVLHGPTVGQWFITGARIASSAVLRGPRLTLNVIGATIGVHGPLHPPSLDQSAEPQFLETAGMDSTAVLFQPDVAHRIFAFTITATTVLHPVSLLSLIQVGGAYYASTGQVFAPRVGSLSASDPLTADPVTVLRVVVADALTCSPVWPRKAGDIYMVLQLKRGNDQIVRVPRLRSALDETVFLNGATVTGQLVNGFGDVVQDILFEYEVGSEGSFRWNIEGSTFMFPVSARYQLIVLAEQEESHYRGETPVSIID